MSTLNESWQAQRVQWNRAGQCARGQCRAPLGDRAHRHIGTGLLYCGTCAALLIKHQGDVLRVVNVAEALPPIPCPPSEE